MKKILLSILLCFPVLALQAQDSYTSYNANYNRIGKESGFDLSRLIFGGGLGLSFGSATSVAVSPVVGYRISDRFAAGISLGYQYFRIRDYVPVINGINGAIEYHPYVSSVYSGGVWGRAVLFQNIFLHSEFEYNILRARDYITDINLGVQKTNVGYNVPCLLLGGGYRQPIGDNASLVLIALYDVLQNIPSNMVTASTGEKYSLSPYAGRLDFRIGLNIGF